ncbi:transporter substrate-binding domain-containing protein [Marinomonas sp. 15G1-11]|uniref:Transporter substrate-binding domain-containing protein n=1 Tax=Marinomonas phaeophyticola TaxID=3004091 RepID=A0ABT4JRT9_9GAMM|nr:transporter substrate-binding domain-containing protein [Marinomonas sp. 15G1-11]MCZ2720737.1 transporter substrate-binding domain-containing protein [Marinomonas sp. 15G1-11]
MRSLLLTCVLFLVCITDASATNSDQFGCNGKIITVGVTDSGVMYHDGKGIDADLIQLLGEITLCEFHLKLISRENAFHLVEQGKIDLVPSTTREPHRESFAWFIPYYEVRILLLTNENRLPVISSLEQFKKLEGVSIARATGSGYGTYFNYHLSEMESLGMVRGYPDYGKTVVALLNGEVDATLSVPLVYRLFFAKGEEPLPLRIADISPGTPTTVSLMLAKHRFSSAQTANWLRVIETLRLNGRLQTIMERYLSKDEALSMLNVSGL